MGTSPAPEVRVKITGEDTGVSAAIKELSTQLQQLKRTQDDASNSATRLGAAERGAGSSMREAREGARLLSEETGVHLNRGLVSVISRSATLGPLISAAFPVAAAIGFGEVIASAAEKLSTLIADTFIYTDAMKSQLAAQVAANNEIAKSNEKIKELKKAYELIGLSGSARETILATRAKEDVDAAIKELERLKAKQIEIEDPGWMKKALGVGLDFIGLDTGIGQPDVDAARATKETQVTAQEKKRDELIEEQRAADKELADQKAADDKEAAAKAKTLQDQINKARLAQIEAGFAGELELYKAQHSLLDQDNEANYVKGLESTAQYYAKKQQLAAESSQKEIDALTAERARVLAAPTKDGAEQIEQQTKAADLANKIAIARVNAEKVQQQLANEGAQKQEEENRKVLDFQAKIAEAQGLRFDEAKAKIAAEAEEMAAGLRKAGIAPDQIAAMVAQFKSAATQQAQFSSMKTTGQDAVANFTDQEEDIRLKNITIVADTKIKELEQTRIPILQQIAAQMKAAAITPEQIKDADDFAKSVDRIAVAAKNSSVSMQSFEQSATRRDQRRPHDFPRLDDRQSEGRRRRVPTARRLGRRLDPEDRRRAPNPDHHGKARQGSHSSGSGTDGSRDRGRERRRSGRSPDRSFDCDGNSGRSDFDRSNGSRSECGRATGRGGHAHHRELSGGWRSPGGRRRTDYGSWIRNERLDPGATIGRRVRDSRGRGPGDRSARTGDDESWTSHPRDPRSVAPQVRRRRTRHRRRLRRSDGSQARTRSRSRARPETSRVEGRGESDPPAHLEQSEGRGESVATRWALRRGQ